MKVVLINPKLKTWSPNILPPLGLTYVAAAIENKHEVQIVDMNSHYVSDKKLIQQISGSDIIGITGMATEYSEVVRLALLVREHNPKAKIILGGALATTWTERVLKESKADFAVMGEGEGVIVNLLNGLNDYRDIKGIAYQKNGEVTINPREEPIPIDGIKFPARHLLHMDGYVNKFFRNYGKGLGSVKGTTTYMSRACPNHCLFCFMDMWGHKWRGRSPENMIAELKQLQKDYGYNGFSFYDDNFIVNRKRVMEFCRQIKEQNLKIYWICNGRIDLMTPELAKAMYESGCRGIAYGIESGNQEIVDFIEKGTTKDQVRRVTRMTEDAGIRVTGLFMLGMLGETKATIQETIEFARELDLSFYCFALTIPLYGTRLYDIAQERGFVSDAEQQDWNFHANSNLTQDCTKEELEQFSRQVFREFNLEKFYGKRPLINPKLWFDGARSFCFLIGKRSPAEMMKKVIGILTK